MPLTQLATSQVSGFVYDGGVAGGEFHGYPLYASLTFSAPGFSQTVYSDPFSGEYAIELYLEQEYNVSITAVPDGYVPFVGIFTPFTDPYTEDFTLYVDAEACTAPGYIEPPENLIYSEDFNDDNGLFTPSGTPLVEWEWGQPSTAFPGACSDGGSCWDTDLDGNYDNSTSQSLVSPAIDLSSVSLQPGDTSRRRVDAGAAYRKCNLGSCIRRYIRKRRQLAHHVAELCQYGN